MDRRTFLKIVGMGSVSLAASCSPPDKTLYSLVQAPDDMVTGKASWYASTCRECPAGCGILAKNREGRVVKVEGNPLHPINKGKLCMRGQAALQGIYNPDRIKTPLLKEKDGWRPVSFSEAEALLQRKATHAAKTGPGKIGMLTEIVGETLLKLFTESLAHWKSQRPMIFEPFAYESLKTANQKVFGIEGMVSYRLEDADVLLSLGADFLDTWLSPVEYAWKFKAMHALNNGKKGVFIHVSPYQSLTGANADQWLACNPGSEAAVAFGLIREILKLGRASRLPRALRFKIENTARFYTREKVSELSGIPPNLYEQLIHRLIRADTPLILGTGTGATGPNTLQSNIAVNYLNLLLDSKLSLFNFDERHRIGLAAIRSEVLEFFKNLDKNSVELLLLNNVNPVYALPSGSGIRKALERDSLFVVAFSSFMDETAELADLVFPARLPLEAWDEYGGKNGVVSTLQPAMGRLTGAPHLGDVFLRAAFGQNGPTDNYKTYLVSGLVAKGRIKDDRSWIRTIQRGGVFEPWAPASQKRRSIPQSAPRSMNKLSDPFTSGLSFIALPSIRFFDGRGANRPWLCEVPDPVSRVAWQTPVLVHPKTAEMHGLRQEDVVRIQSQWGQLHAPVYITESIIAGTLAMAFGQGHTSYGRYAKGVGVNPGDILTADLESISGGPLFAVGEVTVSKSGRVMKLARMYGSRTQQGRKFALSVSLAELNKGKSTEKSGLTMEDFPITLPLRAGYDKKRDFYPPVDYENYRWSMVVDLDKCIGCAACSAACYAENNIGIVGEDRVIDGREMTWLSVERYLDPQQGEKITFLPMLCQHCTNAPCESVCPVYAPHHSKEGINNQIYNRCIGTRFCSQNCPYKVRRFNWFSWNWPKPMNLQLNPDVTVRSKGVMEKCSFCIQRIKAAHTHAKNEKRAIRDGEVIPACVQTCPTSALTFGNLKDDNSRISKLAQTPRAYQIMGYLNTKPAVIYLKKVRQEI
ncbi:MAG: 4Fe-4S dicluster domain-containing protein [Deltaproteobacteria bacterium]|nr:MAG: 4Fe-4S dicluster domain-containing protein [Deltaproteobacteria bacterium]